AVPAEQVGVKHAAMALKVITDRSTAVTAETQTKGSYVDIPLAPSVVPKGARVDVSVDDAAFTHPTSAAINADGSWTATPAGASKIGAHRVYARLVLGQPIASTNTVFSLAAPDGPAVVQLVLTRIAGVPDGTSAP